MAWPSAPDFLNLSMTTSTGWQGFIVQMILDRPGPNLFIFSYASLFFLNSSYQANDNFHLDFVFALSSSKPHPV